MEAVKASGLNAVGPIPLPTKIRRYCVLTSPHVNKDAREHFEIRTHKRIIDVYAPNEKTKSKSSLRSFKESSNKSN